MVNPGYSKNINPDFPEFWDGNLIFLGKVRYRKASVDITDGVKKVTIRFKYSREFQNFYGDMLTDDDKRDGFTEIIIPETDVFDVNKDPIYNRIKLLKAYDGTNTTENMLVIKFRDQIVQQEEIINDLRTQVALLTVYLKEMTLNPMQHILNQKELFDKMGVGKSTVVLEPGKEMSDLGIDEVMR